MSGQDDIERNDEEPYAEYETLGVRYSYSKAGYWGRLVFALSIFAVIIATALSVGRITEAVIFFVVMMVAAGFSLLWLLAYRRRR